MVTSSNRKSPQEFRFLVSRRLGNALFQLSAYLYARDILKVPAKLDCRSINPQDLQILLSTGLFLFDDLVVMWIQTKALKSRLFSRWISFFWRFFEVLEFRTPVKVFRMKNKFTFFAEPDAWLRFHDCDEGKWIFGYFQDVSLVEKVAPLLLQRLRDSTSLCLPPNTGRASVALHRRLGDYALFPQFGILNENFFIENLHSFDTTLVRIVSDQPELALNLFEKSAFAGAFSIQLGAGVLEDFAVLLHAKTLIISNSTFSWWAGYLGKLLYPEKVIIGPNPWHQSGGDCKLLCPQFQWLPASYRVTLDSIQ